MVVIQVKFELDETVFYDGEIMKVWDYSPRTKSYKLKGIDNSDEIIAVPEEIVEEDSIKGYNKFAADILWKLEYAENDVRNGGYGFLRDLGRKVFEAYEKDLLTSQKFLIILVEVIEKKSNVE
jgi:hypothetical protein